ncbi:MAG TPA: DUF1203 domain-containing protein [Gemmatimonadaceae bacterium]|nr:DUF1203 domain-containing protein [Gemmatimonadaceae bacterium]
MESYSVVAIPENGAIKELLSRPEVYYIHVRDTEAGCFDFTIERGDAAAADRGEREKRAWR